MIQSLSYAKLREDIVQHILAIDLAGDGAYGVKAVMKIHGDEFTAETGAEAAEDTLSGG